RGAVKDATGSRSCAILIADDDAGIRSLISSLLAQAGYSTCEAATGEATLASARADPPRLVILDVNLPGLSGYEVCRELRDEFGEQMAIMFVSGERTQSFDRAGGLLLGADDYVVKPFALDELLARVRRLVGRSFPTARSIASKLTTREVEVMRYL